MPRFPSAQSAAPPNIVSGGNSTSTALGAGETFTGNWEDASLYGSVMVAVKTDQAGTYAVEFSPDGVNTDSTLTRYYRIGQIEPPHRFTITRSFVRVTFTNTSASPQTVLRIQTTYGAKQDLNFPLDSQLARDADSVSTRPTDFKAEVSLGLRQGSTLWNKFGFNLLVGTSAEVVAPWGGTFTPMTTARTLSIVSTEATDAVGGTGAEQVTITGIDANRRSQVVTVTMTGLTPVVTTETWLGVNRIQAGPCGDSQTNDGTITATATTDATIQGQVPAGLSVTQQCLFHVQEGSCALAEWLTFNVVRFGSGTEPIVTLRGWVYNPITNTKTEVVRQILNATFDGNITLTPPLPFPLGDGVVFWLEAVSTRIDTTVNVRFSLIEHTDVDAV